MELNMKQINKTDTVFILSQKYPEVIDLLVEFGFNQIKSPQMIATAGKFMTLEKGCKLRGFDYSDLANFLKTKGYEIVD